MNPDPAYGQNFVSPFKADSVSQLVVSGPKKSRLLVSRLKRDTPGHGLVAAPQHEGLILVAAKADMDPARPGLPTSALTGKGIAELAEVLVVRARSMLPKGDELALDRRQHHLLAQARDALVRASEVREPVLVAEELRLARLAIDRIAGRTGVEDLLDSLFRRFCLGK